MGLMFGLNLIDLLLVLAVLGLAFTGLQKTGMPVFRRTAAWLAGILVLHLVLSGFRWQIVPAYGALLLVMLSSLISRRWLRVLSFALVLVLVSASVLTSWAFPIFKIPKTTGPYAVGVTDAFLTDASRSEQYTSDETDHRRLSLRIWYPSDDPKSGSEVAYWQHALLRSRAVTNGIPLPWFTFTHLG